MSDNVNKVTGTPYSGETARDVDFDTFVLHLILEECELQAIRADKLGTGDLEWRDEQFVWHRRDSAPSFEVFTSTWWEQLGGKPSSPYGERELSVTLNSSVVVADKIGGKVARIEARFENLYYTSIPMDDETFVRFSETRVMDDVWPEMKRLVNDMLVKFELEDFIMPERATAGPVKREVRL